MTKIIFNLHAPMKHSGKYVQEGTENDQYPRYFYFPKEWFPNKQLLQQVELTVVPTAMKAS